MANPDEELTVAQRLGRALDRGLLPAGGPAEAAERLIERLERPARVALLGLPGSGKSSILNLLVGASVVPETLRLPTIIVQHGDVSRMICTLTDGTTRIVPGRDLAEVLPLAPALVTVETDLPALGVISLLEVSAGPMEAEQKRAATWASKRADIVIWCSTSYLPKEQAVWESLPDAVKDNSFMFLTKVDLLGSRESASAMHDRVELRAGEEFRQILSISAKQARAATPPDGPVNRDLFRDSGASAVIGAIKTRVQSGRRADMDTAELLLARHVEASKLVAGRFDEPGEGPGTPKTWAPPPDREESAADPAPAEEPIAAEPEDALEAPPEAADVGDEAETVPESDPPDTGEAPEAAEASVMPEIEPELDPEPEVASSAGSGGTDSDPTPAQAGPEPDATTRKRFADRIKRVSSDGDTAAAPLVPLRSTWKSKSEAAAEPEPEPEPRQAAPTRRPRAAATPPVADEPDDIARTLADVVKALEVPPEEAPEDPEEPAAEPAPAPSERLPRAARPLPPPDEAPRPAGPRLFGGRRPVGAAGTPLPDLSALRATPDEIAASAEAREQDLAEEAEDQGEAEASLDDDWNARRRGEESVVTEQDVEPAPDPESRLPSAAVRSAGRPGLVNREPRERPAEPAMPQTPGRMPRGAPITRSPAPPPTTGVAAPTPTPPSARPATDAAQFSPRAIMTRERRAEPETPTARRERPRIAARAVPAADAPVAPVPVSDIDQALVEEAIALIVARSTELAQELDPEAKVPVDLILDHTRETGEQVQAVVSRGQSEALRRINSDLGEVMDLIMLMQLEKGHAPADDALTLLLQLRRELETLRAA